MAGREIEEEYLISALIASNLPTAWREASRRVREGSILVIVDKILGALEDNLIPHSEVVYISFGGNMEQNCAVCNKEFTVTRMWYPGAGLEELKSRLRGQS